MKRRSKPRAMPTAAAIKKLGKNEFLIRLKVEFAGHAPGDWVVVGPTRKRDMLARNEADLGDLDG